MRSWFTTVLISVTASAVAATALATTLDIDQVGQQFSKKNLGVRRGDKVRFHNGDDATHNIYVVDGADKSVDQGLQKPGEVITVPFDRDGRFTVRCNIHPRMKLVVSVE